MKLFALSHEGASTWETSDVLVCADDETQARELAAKSEKRKFWMNKDAVTCEELALEPGVIWVDQVDP